MRRRAPSSVRLALLAFSSVAIACSRPETPGADYELVGPPARGPDEPDPEEGSAGATGEDDGPPIKDRLPPDPTSTDGGVAPGVPGACVRQGRFCGEGTAALGPERHTLYRCTEGKLEVIERCDLACQSKGDASEDDACRTTCPYGEGLYCGGVHVRGEKDALYRCANGKVSREATCNAGCFSAPPDSDDRCK